MLGIVSEPTYSDHSIAISDESPFTTLFFALNNNKYFKKYLVLQPCSFYGDRMISSLLLLTALILCSPLLQYPKYLIVSQIKNSPFYILDFTDFPVISV